MSAVFWTAIVGLAGIAAAFFAPPWTARRIEERRDARERQAAARLVEHEVSILRMTLSTLEQHGVFTAEVVNTVALPTDAWDLNQGVLARTLPSSEDWKLVSRLYGRIYSIKLLAAAGGPRDESRDKMLFAVANTIELAKEVGHMLHHQQLDVPAPVLPANGE